MNWKDLHDKTEELCNVLFGHIRKEPEDTGLREILNRLKDNGYLLQKLEEQESYDYKKAFLKLPRKRIGLKTVFRMTAVILLLMTIGTVAYQYSQDYREDDIDEADFSVQWAGIEHGGHKAVLVKSNGDKVSLTEFPQAIQEEDSLRIQVDSSGLHYENIQEKTADTAMQHTLFVPKGGEYYLVLSDGTQVWLNADSELRYPVAFSGYAREVEVKGEAYFKVSKDKDHPFIVKTPGGEIRVWGTEFNIQSYTETGKTVTTLVNGKVSYLFSDGDEIFMKPSEELTVDGQGRSALRKVDTRYACSWKDGKFIFDQKTLDELLMQLCKWYDLKVCFKDEAAKKLHFSGDLSRYKNIGIFIDMFEQCSDARFTMEEGVLTVRLQD